MECVQAGDTQASVGIFGEWASQPVTKIAKNLSKQQHDIQW
jgi:hypothetical protein